MRRICGSPPGGKPILGPIFQGVPGGLAAFTLRLAGWSGVSARSGGDAPRRAMRAVYPCVAGAI